MRNVRLSSRGGQAPPSPIRKLVPLADGARARGVKVHSVNIGQPDLPTPDAMWAAVRGEHPPVLAYSHSAGIPELRQGLAAYYARHGVPLASEEILVTTGGSEAILFALSSVTDPEDEILIPEPLYANYLGFATQLGVRVVPIPTTADSGYHLPPRPAWEERLSRRTRAILLSNPGNPTGTVYTETEIEMLLGLAEEWGLFLIADEVYREFCYDGRRHRSLLTYPDVVDRVILVDSISKRFSACGARIGCIGSKNPEVMKSALCWAQARLSPPSLGQMAAAAAMQLGESYFTALVAEYETRRDRVAAALAEVEGARFHKPGGAFYVMATLPVDDAERFAAWMLSDFSLDGETTFVAPGNGFYASPGSGNQEVRIAYVLEANRMARAIEVLRAGLRTYPGRTI